MRITVTPLFLLVLFGLLPYLPAGEDDPLGPPGSPEARMKTLNQIEPRTIITNLPYNITNRGAYYLTQNLTGSPGSNGIIISSSDVDLNLNGFSLIGTGTNSGSSGIVLNLVTNYMNLTIHNGIVIGWANAGLVLTIGLNCHLKGISSVGNGLQGGTGIYIGSHWDVEDCIAARNYGIGIQIGNYSKARNCRARENDDYGFYTGVGSILENCISVENKNCGFFGNTQSIIRDCVAVGNTNDGIYVGANSLAMNNLSSDNGGHGISAGQGSRLQGNTSSLNDGDGINVGIESVVERNHAAQNIGAGIRAANGCRVEANHATGNGTGFFATEGSMKNLFIGNSALGNTTNFVTSPNANFARIAYTNSLGPDFVVSNSWSNFDLD
jgi:hypothetical protein